MSDKIRMDSHKLLYHPDRVASWQRGDLIYPIEMEVSLSGACNHRCVFCAVDYMGYKANMLKKEPYMDVLRVFGSKGVRSIIYAGEGEPLLHPDASEIINATKAQGIDAALATNAALFTKEKAEDCLHSLSWVRVSIAAARDATYEKIHQCRKGDLQRVYRNMETMARVKWTQRLQTTLGAQLLLLPENVDEVIELAVRVRDMGFDYFTVKPFSPHPQSKAKVQVDYSESAALGRALRDYETDTFKIYFRSHSIENLAMEKPYSSCQGLHFMAHIDAIGDVFPCVAHVGRREFVYGNIYDQPFDELWESERARKIRAVFNDAFIHANCRKACRLDEMNKYLDELRHPGAHVNFI